MSVERRDRGTRRIDTAKMRSATCVIELCFPRSGFTGKERDTESGNDCFEARYYASSMGSFLNPDRLWVKADRMLLPQKTDSRNERRAECLESLDGYWRENGMSRTFSQSHSSGGGR
jgi:RHS repeat-associated protein